MIRHLYYWWRFLRARRKVQSPDFVESLSPPLPTALTARWMPYGHFIAEVQHELPNAVNLLIGVAADLRAWSEVIRELSVPTKVDLLVVFFREKAMLGLCLPYALRARFAFAAAHLCHQANKLSQGATWKDNLPVDKYIDFGTANKYGHGWNTYEAFRVSMKTLNSVSFKEKTRDFRDKFTHRLSPGIEVGLTNLVERNVTPGGHVSYGIGAAQPLSLAQIASALDDEVIAAKNVLVAFTKLIDEHAVAIGKSLEAASSP